MRKRKTLSTIIILLVGIVVGFTVAVLIGTYFNYRDPYTLLRGHPKRFGDIKIVALKPLDFEEDEDVDKVLMMTKDDVPFLVISQNESGKVSDLTLLRDRDTPVFRMKPLSTQGKWGQAIYSGSNEAGKAVGDVLIDIDFDGRFDFRLVLDSEGERISRSIFIDGSWQSVNYCNPDEMIATLGQTKYIFDPNSGWQVKE